MDQGFIKAYKQLNARQKQAVDSIDGPLLVLAGPGTGKTQLLSVRVANILAKTDTDPANILCLTFTNFAANNMSERLLGLIGEQAHSVNIKTFHSFGAEIMQLYPEYFWNGAELKIIPDSLLLDMLSGILDDLPHTNVLTKKFAGKYSALKDVSAALKLAKEAGLTPGKLEAMLKANLAYIDAVEEDIVSLLSPRLSSKNLDPLRVKVHKLIEQNIDKQIQPLLSLSTEIKTSLEKAISLDEGSGKVLNVSRWKASWIQNLNGRPGMWLERKRNNWWLDLCAVYQMYRERMHSLNYYDYSDMIVEVISKLEQEPELLSLVQERYHYVLIDEFQDTTAAQMRLAQLASESYLFEGKPNLMAVGDDDQAIYAFNGADLNNMNSFIRLYQNADVIPLKDNYRSTQDIIDASQSIIEKSTSRLSNSVKGISKKLRAAANLKKRKPQHLIYPTCEQQLHEVANAIKLFWQKNSGQSIAVLARNNESLVSFSALLNHLNVPISYERQNNVLDNPLIDTLLNLAEVLSAINNGDGVALNYYLSRLLSNSLWQIKPAALWRLAQRSRSQRENWLDCLAKSADQKLKDIAAWLLWLAKLSRIENLSVTLEYMIGLRASEHLTSPLRGYYLEKAELDSSYLESLSALNVLNSYLSEYLNLKTRASLDDFLGFIRLHKENSETITDQSWFSTSDNAVQLMTVHKAKGLEFDHVYLIDAVDRSWRPNNRRLTSPANLPLQPYGEDIDDYIRLAYVAVTRAKDTFTLTSYDHSMDGDKLLPSPIFSSISRQAASGAALKLKDKIDTLEQSLISPQLVSSNMLELLKPTLAEFKLSPTGLNEYLDIVNNGPEAFINKNILLMPQLSLPHLGYGVAIHSALETAQELVNKDQLSLEPVIKSFEDTLRKQRLHQTDETRYLDKGRAVLTDLIKSFDFKSMKDGLAEVSLSSVKLPSGAVISGKLDNILQNKRSLVITDYKTGRPLTNFNSKAKDKAIKSWQHKNQLLFYTLLVTKSPRFSKINQIQTRIMYLEAENTKDLILNYLPMEEELTRLTDLISAVYSQIVSLTLPDTSKYPKTIAGIKALEEDLLNRT